MKYLEVGKSWTSILIQAGRYVVKIKNVDALEAEFTGEAAETSVLFLQSIFGHKHLSVLDGLVWTSYRAGLG